MPRDASRPTDRELRFILALMAGQPVTKAAESAGYSRAHGRALAQRSRVRDTLLNFAQNLLAFAARNYR